MTSLKNADVSNSYVMNYMHGMHGASRKKYI